MKKYYYTNKLNHIAARIIVLGTNDSINEQWIQRYKGNWDHKTNLGSNIRNFRLELYNEMSWEEVQEMLFIGNI